MLGNTERLMKKMDNSEKLVT